MYQVQGGGSKWKIETAIHNFCNNKAESARALGNQREVDHFLPDQRYGIIRDGTRIHGGPRETITMASYSSYLMEYICTKNRQTSQIFKSVDWEGFYLYMESLDYTKLVVLTYYTTGYIMDTRITFSKVIETTT